MRLLITFKNFSMIKKISRVLGAILILVNLGFFIPVTLKVLMSGGGSFGFGLLLLPITFVSHLFVVPATLTWINKTNNRTGFMVTNSLGIIWTLLWLTFFSRHQTSS